MQRWRGGIADAECQAQERCAPAEYFFAVTQRPGSHLLRKCGGDVSPTPQPQDLRFRVFRMAQNVRRGLCLI